MLWNYTNYSNCAYPTLNSIASFSQNLYQLALAKNQTSSKHDGRRQVFITPYNSEGQLAGAFILTWLG